MLSHSLANFVGIVVGFLNVSIIRLRSLLAAALSFECNLVLSACFCDHAENLRCVPFSGAGMVRG